MVERQRYIEGTHISKKTKNITGQVFGRLTVVYHHGWSHSWGAVWLCKCECGKETKVRGSNLRNGLTKSCGCLAAELAKKRNYKASHPKNNGLAAEYSAWLSMKYRCYYPTYKKYGDYGGRGIKVCDRWLESFENFLSDMGPRPSSKHSLDRYPNNETGNYEPGNCRWGTKKEQANNTRGNKIVIYRGQSKTLSEWKSELGFCYETVMNRLRAGYSPEEAFETPAWNLDVERKGYVFTEEHRIRLISRLKKPVLQYTKEGDFVKEFISIKDAGMDTGIGSRGISECACGKKKSAGGYLWRHKN
jgi:NUMOD1 domain-containing protein